MDGTAKLLFICICIYWAAMAVFRIIKKKHALATEVAADIMVAWLALAIVLLNGNGK